MTYRFVKVGEAAPDFIFKDRNGKTLRLTDFRGKVVVINFWASWCLPCREEMPDLQAVYDEYQEQGLVVLGINTTYLDSLENAYAFIDDLRLTFPIVFDETGEVAEQSYLVRGLPTSFWVDQDGIVRLAVVGAMTREKMVDTVHQLLPYQSKP